jgi:hypothetical protein
MPAFVRAMRRDTQDGVVAPILLNKSTIFYKPALMAKPHQGEL